MSTEPSYGKCRKTEEWELNRARYRLQWIDKSTAYVQGWLGYVYPSRANWTTSNLGYVKESYNRNRGFVGVGLPNLSLDLSDPYYGRGNPAPTISLRILQFLFT